MYAKFANAITSPYSKSPYAIEIADPNGEYEQIQEIIEKTESESTFKNIVLQAVKHACITGTGFLVLSLKDGKIIPEIVRDVSQVALDPFIQELDAGDSEQAAIVNFISLSRAKRLYGDEICDSKNEYYLSALGDQWDIPSGMIPLVSYYKMNESGTVDLYKICGDKVLNETPINIPCSRIPIFRISFNEIVRNNKIDYSGIVDATKDLSKGLNIAYSQLLERANRTPKSNFLMPARALDGLEEFYQKLNTKESLVTLYNGDVPPTPIVESYQTQDLVTTIDGINNLMAQVIGVPTGGIQPAINQQTATQTLIQQINSESNVNSLYENAYQAIYNMNKTMLEILCWQYDLPVPNFKLISGPAVITKKMKTRQDLIAVSQFVGPELQPVIAKSYLETLDKDISEPVLTDLIANSPLQFISDRNQDEDPRAISMLNNMNSVLEQTQNQLEGALQQMAQLKQENDSLKLQLLSTKEQNILNMQKHNDEMNYKYAQLELEKEKAGVEADIKTTENSIKANAEITKLENERMKIVSDAVKNIEE